MSDITTVKTQLSSLLSLINSITDKGDANLTDAINSVILGYGSGNCNISQFATEDDLIGDISIAVSKNIRKYALFECTGITSISIAGYDSTISIGYYAFANCSDITHIIFNWPGSISYYIVNNCSSLTTVVFSSKPTLIHSSAFLGASALTDIYVPWSDGEVANAPWGAENATIHYNSDIDVIIKSL